MEIIDAEISPTDIKRNHERRILPRKVWLCTRPAEHGIRKTDKATPAHHIARCFVEFDGVLPHRAETRMLRCAKYRIERITPVDCVRDIRIPTENHYAENECSGRKQYIFPYLFALLDEDIDSAHCDKETEIHQSGKF